MYDYESRLSTTSRQSQSLLSLNIICKEGDIDKLIFTRKKCVDTYYLNEKTNGLNHPPPITKKSLNHCGISTTARELNYNITIP